MTTRRHFIGSMAAGGAYAALPGGFAFAAEAAGRAIPVPTAAQRRWADMELGMFFHFDIPIYGGGKTPPAERYNPAKLDTDQWMEAAKAYGAKYVVLTAKHGAGFMQWQSDIYPYGVKQAPWRDGECDVPLGRGKWLCTDHPKRPYWTMDYLVNMYDRSVGRNCNLLLNAAPRQDGLITDAEMKIYAEFGRRIKARYANRLCATEGEGESVDLAVPKDSGPVNQIVLMERIEHGERIRKFALEALVADKWQKLYEGTCVGHKHIVRFDKTDAIRLRLSVQSSVAKPLIRDFSAYCN